MIEENEDITGEDLIESAEEKAMRLYLSEIMKQLLQRDRFRHFFECNYEVKMNVNEETQQVQILLMEFDPHIAQQRLQNLVEKCAADSTIVKASPADLETLKKQNV